MPRRPSHIVNGPTLTVTIPARWNHHTTAISRQKYQHLVTINNDLYPDSTNFLASKWNKANVHMEETGGLPFVTMASQQRDAIIDYNFYFSTTRVRDNILSLENVNNQCRGLQVIEFNKRSNVPSFIPDYQTLIISVNDAQTAERAGGLFNDMVIIVNMVDLDEEPDNPNPDPPPPPPNTRPGYNPALDTRRPSTIEYYLKYYDTVFLIDDSGSMASGNPTKWDECVQAVIGIADTAINEDQDGIDIYFLNSDNVFSMRSDVENVTDKSKVAIALAQVGPSGGTPTGERLRERLDAHLRKIDAVAGQSTYSEIKPLDLIVITDGCPNDNKLVISELEKAANYITDKNYHPNHMGIQFVQIGNDSGADTALQELTQARVNGMVDTVPYTRNLTPEVLKRILLGGLHPNIRAQRGNP